MLQQYGCTSVLVSWDGDGLFTGPYDNVTMDTLGDPGVSIDLGKDGARQLSPPKVSSADLVLRNDTATYSQEHSASPVYQRVVPGRPVRIEMQNGVTDAYDTATPYDEADYYDGSGTWALARTAIDDIAQQTAIGQQTVTLRTLGIETLLVGTTVSVGVMTAPRVDQCITAILDAVGWPSGQRAISIADTTLLLWWADDRSPWDALLELLASEGPGALYVTAENGGTIHFENRNYRVTADRSVNTQAGFFDRRAAAGTPYYDEALPYDEPYAYDGEADVLYFTSLSYDPGFRNIYNAARYTTKRRVLAGSPSVIWTYGTTLQPSASGTTLIIHPPDPFQNAIVPVAGTDYTVSGGTVTMSLSATSGLVAFLTVTATSGTPTVAGLQLRAQPLTVVGETTVTNLVDASASIAKFSPIPGANIPRVLDVAGWPEIDVSAAQAVCDAWITRYMVQRPSVTIEVRNADAAHMLEILRRTISDRISLLERNSGLSADVWVNSKALTISGAGGRDVRCQLACEKVDEVGGSRWDVSTSTWDHAIWGI
jgi:hypothetical protein